jgi:hypothetical protein
VLAERLPVMVAPCSMSRALASLRVMVLKVPVRTIFLFLKRIIRLSVLRDIQVNGDVSGDV